MISSILAKSLLCPGRQPLVKNPEDYGMSYSDIEFQTPDNVRIKGWLIHGSSNKLVIMTHPMPFTRYGFSPKHQGLFKVTNIEVQLLRTAVHLNKAGYHVLMFDFRNHGESGKGNRGYTAVGLHEWPDIIGALNYIKSDENLKNYDTGFVSHCMGANATIIAMSRAAENVFDKVKCLVAIQPVSMNILVPQMIEDAFPAFKAFVTGIDKKSVSYTGFSLKEMSPLSYVKDIKVPVLFVQVRNDPWTKPEDIMSFCDNTVMPKELFWIEGKKHRFDGYNYFGDTPERLLEFLKKYM